jgi:hypothetical protein
MVELFNCRCGNSGAYMSPSDTGNWVFRDDYEKLHRLLSEARDSLETSVPLRGDTTQDALIARIETALKED